MTLVNSLLRRLIAIALGATAAQALVAQAAFPDRPVRIVVPYPAGSNTDDLARALASDLTDRLGQPVLIDNRGGAGGTIGTQAVVQSAPDGYTMLLHTNAIVTEPAVKRNLPYDARRDLLPLSMVSESPNVLLVHPSMPVKSVAELIAYAKANPGKVNFGSSGPGTLIHMATEHFKAMAAIDIIHVPYRGGAQSQPALMAGEVQMLIDPLPSSRALAASGRVRALAVTSQARTSLWPDLPTVAESGLPAYDSSVWFGLFLPAGTPTDVVDRLSKEVRGALAGGPAREQMLKRSATPVGDSPEQFRAKVDAEFDRWKRIAESAALKPE